MASIPVNTLVCQHISTNVYRFTFFIKGRDPVDLTRQINGDASISSLFGVADSYIITKYGVKHVNPLFPTDFGNGDTFSANTIDYKIVLDKNEASLPIPVSGFNGVGLSNVPIIEKSPTPPREITYEKYICHGFDISKTMTQFHIEDMYTCRYETVANIKAKLDKYKVALLRAPPYCGKTILLSLIRDYLVSKGEQVFIINGLNFDRKQENVPAYFESFWKKQTGDNTYIATLERNCYILIDEAQILYNTEPHLWARFKSISQSGSEQTSKIFIVSYYGDRPVFESTTPVDFSHVFDYRDILLTDNECNELLAKYNSQKSQEDPTLTSNVQYMIKSVTGRHVGLIVKTVERIKEKYGNSKPSDGEVQTFLISGAFIETLLVLRVTPNDNEIQKYFEFPYIEYIMGIIDNPDHYIPSADVYVNELIYKGLITQSHPKPGDMFVSRIGFASPLIMNIFNYKYTRAKVSTLESKYWKVDELWPFIFGALSRMNLYRLKNSFSVGNDGRLLERAWQNEFYRCAYSLLSPQYHTISPDVGYSFGSSGKVDFYVNGSIKWMIEITREGSQLGEHLARFTQGGRYYPMLEKINYWIIIDFRKILPLTPSDNVCHCVYDYDHNQFHVRIKDRLTYRDYLIKTFLPRPPQLELPQIEELTI